MIVKLLCYVIPFLIGLHFVPMIHGSGLYAPLALLGLAFMATLTGTLLAEICHVLGIGDNY